MNIYRDSKILRSDSVAAESIIVKLLNLNGDDYWNDNDREGPNAEGQLQDYQCEGKLQCVDRI